VTEVHEKEVSLTEYSFAAVYFPTLKETRQAVAMCALEADISLDNRLTRHGLTEYRIGSLPLYVTSFNPNSWMIYCFSSSIGKLPASLEPFFPGGVEEFNLKCREAKLVGLDGARWSRRAQAVQAVRSFMQGLP
jgi:hypothetical protein